VVACAACETTPTLRGVEMGSFEFQATLTTVGENDAGCPYAELPQNGFAFVGGYSEDEGKVWLTLGGAVREAEFDGQVASSTHSAPRQFPECECATVTMSETLKVALLSRSQHLAAGSACPPNPLDGGVPAPDPDAGVTPPGRTDRGLFDAVRACGELIDEIVPGDGCVCAGCTVRYSVEGRRK
jgi:hypothetical protein